MKTTLKELWNFFEKEWKEAEKANKERVHKQPTVKVDWKEFMIRPIVDRIKALGYQTTTDELRQFGLSSHVPVTFFNDKIAFYIDFSHSSDYLYITDFESEKKNEYPTGSIGQINGFNYVHFVFDETKTVDDVVEFIMNNKEKLGFKIELEEVMERL